MEENKEEQEVKKELPKKNNKLVLAVFAIAFLLIGTGVYFSFTDTFANKKEVSGEQVETSNSSNEQKEPTNDESKVESAVTSSIEVVETVEKVDITDNIKVLYIKFHGSNHEIVGFLEKVYTNEKYDIREIDFESTLSDFSNYILGNAVISLNSNSLDAPDKKEIITQTIKEEYRKYLGKNASEIPSEFDIDQACVGIVYNETQYVIDQRCGGTSEYNADFNLTKAEKDNNHLYLYEEVSIKNTNSNEANNYVYKWTFDLQEDGNYYFLKAERQ